MTTSDAHLVIMKELAQGIGLEIKEDGGYWLIKHYTDIDSKVIAYTRSLKVLTAVVFILISED